MRRFYKLAVAASIGDGHTVMLDGRALRTPSGAALRLPCAALADAVAEEWRRQGEEVDVRGMDMMSLATTAIDRVAPRRRAVAAELARYGETDLTCYREDPDRPLGRRQEAAWQPLLDWLSSTHGVCLRPTSGLMPISQPRAALDALRGIADAQDPFRLAALANATTLTGSVVIGLAFLAGELEAGDAWERAHIDEAFQAERWGGDGLADERAARGARDLAATGRFLTLLRANGSWT